MNPRLTPELQSAVDQQHGGPLCVEAEGATYVLMSVDAYRALLGLSDDADFAASVAAVRRGMEDARAGRTRPAMEVLDEIAARHGISR